MLLSCNCRFIWLSWSSRKSTNYTIIFLTWLKLVPSDCTTFIFSRRWLSFPFLYNFSSFSVVNLCLFLLDPPFHLFILLFQFLLFSFLLCLLFLHLLSQFFLISLPSCLFAWIDSLVLSCDICPMSNCLIFICLLLLL